MPRTTIVLVSAFVLAACTPCQAAMATPPPWVPQVPGEVVAAATSWLQDAAVTTLAPMWLAITSFPLGVARRHPPA